VPQNLKWQKRYIPVEIENNFKIINKAIKKHYEVVVLPESAFPLFLNLHKSLMSGLKKLSQKIIIVTGALHYKNKKFFNSTYVFDKGEVKILDKHLLVPFGEYIPFPIFEKEINHIFFDNSSDYSTSSSFGIFELKNYKFINGICYELTSEKLYKLKPNYVIGMSNLAWFKPSIMPGLQEMLIKVYARKYKKIVFHSINGFRSETIR
jgi:apolipoprotein N-acyltransferase